MIVIKPSSSKDQAVWIDVMPWTVLVWLWHTLDWWCTLALCFHSHCLSWWAYCIYRWKLHPFASFHLMIFPVCVWGLVVRQQYSVPEGALCCLSCQLSTVLPLYKLWRWLRTTCCSSAGTVTSGTYCRVNSIPNSMPILINSIVIPRFRSMGDPWT